MIAPGSECSGPRRVGPDTYPAAPLSGAGNEDRRRMIGATNEEKLP